MAHQQKPLNQTQSNQFIQQSATVVAPPNNRNAKPPSKQQQQISTPNSTNIVSTTPTSTCSTIVSSAGNNNQQLSLNTSLENESFNPPLSFYSPFNNKMLHMAAQVPQQEMQKFARFFTDQVKEVSTSIPTSCGPSSTPTSPQSTGSATKNNSFSSCKNIITKIYILRLMPLFL